MIKNWFKFYTSIVDGSAFSFNWVGLAVAAYGAYEGSKSAKEAAATSRAGYDAATTEQARQFDFTQEQMAPYQQAGLASLGQYQKEVMGYDPNSITFQDRGYLPTDLQGNVIGGEEGYRKATTSKYGSQADWQKGMPLAHAYDMHKWSGDKSIQDKYDTAISEWTAQDPSKIDDNLKETQAFNRKIAEQRLQEQAGAGTKTDYTSDIPQAFKFGAEEFNQYKDPGYEFRRSEGLRALDRVMAKKGQLGGGSRKRGLMDLSQNLASQEFGAARGRAFQDYGSQVAREGEVFKRSYGTEQDRLNRLATMSGQGQTAATNLAGLRSDYASNVGNLAVGSAGATAAGQLGQAGAITGGLQNISQMYGMQQGYGGSGSGTNVFNQGYGDNIDWSQGRTNNPNTNFAMYQNP